MSRSKVRLYRKITELLLRYTERRHQMPKLD